ncbi:MAG: hypothetical protein ACOC5A_03010 [Halanaerobiales bacterium]
MNNLDKSKEGTAEREGFAEDWGNIILAVVIILIFQFIGLGVFKAVFNINNLVFSFAVLYLIMFTGYFLIGMLTDITYGDLSVAVMIITFIGDFIGDLQNRPGGLNIILGFLLNLALGTLALFLAKQLKN